VRTMLLFILALLPGSGLYAFGYEKLEVTDDGKPLTIGNIRVLSVHNLFTTVTDGLDMVELSGLAWSEDEQTLYAVSDQGSLFHFGVTFARDKISEIDLKQAYALRNQNGTALVYPYNDSEGLHILKADNGVMGDEELLVSFENRPRLWLHKPNGDFLRHELLPGYLLKRASYRKRHKALEAVTIHNNLGLLVVPELPLAGADWDKIALYGPKYRRHEVPRDVQQNFSVCAIESMGDGSLILLLRRYHEFPPAWEVELQRIILNKGSVLNIVKLANFKSSGKVPVDNYEGLTRHKGNRFFMVSDNNEFFMQRTLLVYFEFIGD